MNRKLVLNSVLKANQGYNTQVLKKNFDNKDITIDNNNLININTYTEEEADDLFEKKLIYFLPGDGEFLQWNATTLEPEWVDINEFDISAWLEGLTGFDAFKILTFDDVAETFVWNSAASFLDNYFTKAETTAEINTALSNYDASLWTSIYSQFYTEIEIDDFLSTINFNISELQNDVSDLQTSKQNDLLQIVPAPTSGEFLAYNGTSLIWVNEPSVDLSNYYTKGQTNGLIDGSINDFYNDVILIDYMLATDINTALSLKQDSLVTLTPAPSAGQFLSYNGTILLWENAPTTDLSNYFTKGETQGVVDESINDFYNDVVLVDFEEKLLNIANTGENNIVRIDGSGQLQWVNIYDEYLNNYVQGASLNFLLSLYLLKTDAANWYEAKLNFTEHGEIIIWDGINEEIDYILLNEYSGFDNYYLKSAIDSTLLLYYTKNEMITILDNQYYQKSEIDYRIAEAVDPKQDDLLQLVPAPTNGQVLSYNGATLLWINPPQTDLSNYYDKPAVDGLLYGKEDALTPLVPDPTGYSYVLFWDSFDQEIKWTTNPGFLVTYEDFWDQLNEKLYISTYDAFLITNTAAINAKEDKLNFTQNGEIAIYDGAQIEYELLENYSSFANYYLSSEIDTLLDGKENDLTNLYYLPNYVLSINGGVISWQDPSSLISLQDYATEAWVSDELSLYVLTASLNGILSDYALLADVYTTTFIDANFYTKTEVDTLLTNYALTTTLSNYRLIADSYSQNEIDTMLLDYVLSSDLTTTLADYRLISDSYSQTQINDALALKQNDILSNYTHSANQVLAVNATNDALVFVDESGGGTDVSAYLEALSGYGTGLFLTYQVSPQQFYWKTAAEIEIPTYLYLSENYYTAYTCNETFCTKTDSVNNSETFTILNNSSSSYHFTIRSVSNEYIKLYYAYYYSRFDYEYFRNTSASQVYLQMEPSVSYYRNNTHIFYNNASSQYYVYMSANSTYFNNDDYYFRNSANNYDELFIDYSNRAATFKTRFFNIDYNNTHLRIDLNSAYYNYIYFRLANLNKAIFWVYDNGSGVTWANLQVNRVASGSYLITFRNASGSILSYIEYTTGSLIISSDARMKENICKCSCQLKNFEKVSNLFCNYQLKDDIKKETEYGVLAEEVLECEELKNMVHLNEEEKDEKGESNGKEEYYAVDYTQFNTYCSNLLFEKCKQQDVLISEQSKKIADLEEKLEIIEEKINELLLEDEKNI